LLAYFYFEDTKLQEFSGQFAHQRRDAAAVG
jgi:hypothetical protein